MTEQHFESSMPITGDNTSTVLMDRQEVDPKRAKVREIFESVARRYDFLNDVISLGLHRQWKRRCVEAVNLQPGMTLLDIASGTCDLAMAFARITGPQNVTASDINEEMLRVGQARMEAANLPCHTVLADGEHLPFADNTFDRVTVSFGIRNMTNKDQALREMFRVLKPHGELFVLEFSQCDTWAKPFYDLYSFTFIPAMGFIFAGDAQSYKYLAKSIRLHPNQPTFAKMMTEAGFEYVSWQNLTFGVVALHRGVKP